MVILIILLIYLIKHSYDNLRHIIKSKEQKLYNEKLNDLDKQVQELDEECKKLSEEINELGLEMRYEKLLSIKQMATSIEVINVNQYLNTYYCKITYTDCSGSKKKELYPIDIDDFNHYRLNDLLI